MATLRTPKNVQQTIKKTCRMLFSFTRLMAKLTNSPIIRTLDHRIVEIYTLPCAPGGYVVSEQVRTAGPDGAEQPPPDRKKRKGLVVGIVGGLLTASAVVLALNGGPPFIEKDATLSIVAPAEITDASRTLDPATSEQLASRAKECSVPLAQVAIWKTPGASGGAIRIRSGSYISPVFTLTDAPQRVAIPFPAPYASGQGVISVEGAADGAVISVSPAWHINSPVGSASLHVIWTPKDPC
jgi:hypothetical protein